MKNFEDQPRPGTEVARAKGCICPVMDNHYGAGWGGDGMRHGWIVVQGCPLHAPLVPKETK